MFLNVFVEQFARAHSEATRAALAYQRSQAGNARPRDKACARARAASFTAELLDRLDEIHERRSQRP